MDVTAHSGLGTFETLSRASEAYLSPETLPGVYQAYAIGTSAVNEGKGLTAGWLELSIAIATRLAEQKVQPEYLAAVMLYYPVSSETLSETEVPPSPFGTRTNAAVRNLLSLGEVVDLFLPWASKETAAMFAELLKSSQMRSVEELGSPDRSSNAAQSLLRAVFHSGSPEVAVAKALERLLLLTHFGSLVSDEVRRYLAWEALDVHASTMEILGVFSVKWQLEDAAFRVLAPAHYHQTAHLVSDSRAAREASIDSAVSDVRTALAAAGVSAEVTGRPKHLYSLWSKSQRTGSPLSAINDTLGLRVVADEVADCYAALSAIQSKWDSVAGIYEAGLCRDWIANPKPNGYRSIHTTVWFPFSSGRRQLEVQIRTRSMHHEAEYGVSAHWLYKAGTDVPSKYKEYVSRMKKLRSELEAHRV